MPNKTTANVKKSAKQAASSVPAAKDNSLKTLVRNMGDEIKKALPQSITPDRFTRIVQSALSNDPKLQECTPQSFLGAMMMAAQLGLELNTPLGQAYLLPFNNRRNGQSVVECQFILGYKGLINLAYRSGQINTIQAHVVYEKDEFSYCYGLKPDIVHVPYKGQDRGEAKFFYAVFNTKDGGYGFDVMSVEEVKAHAARYSKSYNSKYSPWTTNFESMALKTVLKRALKYAPISTELSRQVNTDESIKSIPTTPSLAEDVDVIDMPNEVTFSYEVEEDAESLTGKDSKVEFEEQIQI